MTRRSWKAKALARAPGAVAANEGGRWRVRDGRRVLGEAGGAVAAWERAYWTLVEDARRAKP